MQKKTASSDFYWIHSARQVLPGVFNTGEPNTIDDECAAIKYSNNEGEGYGINDVNCKSETLMGYICEFHYM